jgi:hypothetical protein
MMNYRSEAAAVYATIRMGDWTDSATQSVGVSDQLRYTGKQQPPPPPLRTEHEAAWAPELVLDCFAAEI